jgi:hypothetical protein
VHAAWIEPLARCPNDDADPTLRRVTLDAGVLDNFLNGLRQLGPTLERIAQALDDVPHSRLRVVAGAKA